MCPQQKARLTPASFAPGKLPWPAGAKSDEVPAHSRYHTLEVPPRPAIPGNLPGKIGAGSGLDWRGATAANVTAES